MIGKSSQQMAQDGQDSYVSRLGGDASNCTLGGVLGLLGGEPANPQMNMIPVATEKNKAPVMCENYRGWHWSLHPNGPKWVFTCGDCEMTWAQRVHIISRLGVRCPYCGVVNVLIDPLG